MRPKTTYIGAAVLVLCIILYFVLRGKDSASSILHKVKKGNFEVIVTNTGELRAKNFTEVKGPILPEELNIWQLKISNLIPEGTNVKVGDFVAELDKTEVMNKLNEEQINVNKKQSEYIQTQLDTTITLRDARDDLVNLKYAVEEARIKKEQSIYEPPAQQRQTEIEYERAIRNYEQKQENYKTKKAQSAAKMEIVNADLEKAKAKLDHLVNTTQQLTITARKNGMVTYAKDWNGRKLIVGSTIQTWNPIVANLPDLDTMESVTFVNEVDIQKIKKDQKVIIGFDAQPGKKLNGIVKSVASIGEQKFNSEAKLFEVVIEVLGKDTTLRPSMTTSNQIIASVLPEAVSVPIEAIHNSGGKIFVYKKIKGKGVKQEIKTGVMNENSVEIINGLKEDDEVFLSLPTDTSGNEFIALPFVKK
ncbi:MAG: efflux RND transporter periplasmic adaptor subunit [Bacteroidia bacterium]